MSIIPKPSRQKKLSPDPSIEYLQIWKQRFNEIDPCIHASIQGDTDFPHYYNAGFNPSRLSDAYNVDVQLFISVKGDLCHLLEGNLCCCLHDTSFAIGWIHYVDENLDTMSEEPIPWKELYCRVIEKIKKYRERIPVPPSIEKMKDL